jgi:hypothetical protein
LTVCMTIDNTCSGTRLILKAYSTNDSVSRKWPTSSTELNGWQRSSSKSTRGSIIVRLA